MAPEGGGAPSYHSSHTEPERVTGLGLPTDVLRTSPCLGRGLKSALTLTLTLNTPAQLKNQRGKSNAPLSPCLIMASDLVGLRQGGNGSTAALRGYTYGRISRDPYVAIRRVRSKSSDHAASPVTSDVCLVEQRGWRRPRIKGLTDRGQTAHPVPATAAAPIIASSDPATYAACRSPQASPTH